MKDVACNIIFENYEKQQRSLYEALPATGITIYIASIILLNERTWNITVPCTTDQVCLNFSLKMIYLAI